MDTLSRQLIAMIAQHMDMDEAQIDPAKPLSEAGIDSLEMIEIVTMIEDHLSIVIPDPLLSEIDSLADLVRVVGQVVRTAAEPALP